MTAPQAFGPDGFVVVPGALDRDNVAEMRKRCLAAVRLEPGSRAMVTNAVQRIPELCALLDAPPVLRHVVGEIGAFIRVLATEVVLRRAGDPGLAWHRDGGPLMRHLEGVTHVKAQTFLTGVEAPGRGNLVLLRGSHRRPLPERGSIPERPVGEVMLEVQPGDAVIWDASLLHRVEPNRGDADRASVIVTYGFLWMHPYDHSRFEAPLGESTPLQRMLLSESIGEAHPYYPTDADRRIALLAARLGPLDPLPFSDLTPYALGAD